MEDNDFDKTLKSLKSKVGFVTGKSPSPTHEKASSFKKMLNFGSKYRSIIMYSAIPVSILILLIFLKPAFVYEEIKVEGQMPQVKMSMKKLFIAVFISSSMLVVLLFLYLKRRQKNNSPELNVLKES